MIVARFMISVFLALGWGCLTAILGHSMGWDERKNSLVALGGGIVLGVIVFSWL